MYMYDCRAVGNTSLLQGQLVHASVRERYWMWNKQKEEVEREGEGMIMCA